MPCSKLMFVLCCSIVLSTAAARQAAAQLAPFVGYGPSVELPEPTTSLIPTVDVAPAKGWQEGQKPIAAPGFIVEAFATGLDHPRWLFVLPNGDVLVAESKAPERPEFATGVKGFFMAQVMEKAGASGRSANRITLLRDTNGDGRVDVRSTFLEGLNSPFGMALVDDDFYVANTDAVLRFDYTPGATRLEGPGERKFELPAGPLNHHWTRNILASRDGAKLYATVGSNSNAAENGLDQEYMRAAILELDPQSGGSRVFASGLRNPNGLAWNPVTGELWTVVNERDELGDDLVPDYMTVVKEGGFYGWPYSYFGQHVDERVQPPRPDLVAKAIVPDYALGSHTACMGIVFYDADAFATPYRGGAFISQHGSWNRSKKSGYQVIFVPFENGRPSGMPEVILTGFLNENGEALGRPVGIAVDKTGALLVADDVGNAVWRVVPDPTVKRPQAPTGLNVE